MQSELRARAPLPVEYLSECISYNPDTGVLTWKARPFSHFGDYRIWRMYQVKTGCVALATPMKSGYLHGSIDSRRMLAHRAAWALHFGEWPVHDIDHRDLDRANNRIANLRAATFHQNAGNRPAQANNKLGVKGVMMASNGRYVAQIRRNGRSTHIGTFDSIEAASNAYRQAAIIEFGEFHRW